MRNRRYRDELDITPPLDLLNKLLVFVRTPDVTTDEDGAPRIEPTHDNAWCYAANVSGYERGWHRLAADGYVELERKPDEMSGDLSATILAVRFTDKGLEHAIRANTPDGIIHAQEEDRARKKAEEDQQRYAGQEGFGQF